MQLLSVMGSSRAFVEQLSGITSDDFDAARQGQYVPGLARSDSEDDTDSE